MVGNINMIWIIFYVLPIILIYVIPFWMTVNRAEEGTTIGDLVQGFADVIEPAIPLGVFILVTFLPCVNIILCMAIMLICLYIKIKDIRVK